VKVCVQDNGEPGAGRDVLHVSCGGCPYDTTTAASSEILTQGNVSVRPLVVPQPPATPQASSASVLTLEPPLGLSGVPGFLQTLKVTLYDSQGSPLSGVPVSLVGGSPLASIAPLGAVTDARGQLSFTVRALVPLEAVWTAQAAGVQSNPVAVSWAAQP
jgi:hypothetical protein